MHAGGPVHDAIVSVTASDPRAEADGQGAGGCEGVSVCAFVFGGILIIVSSVAKTSLMATILESIHA